MRFSKRWVFWCVTVVSGVLVMLGSGFAQGSGETSYMPVDIKETFTSIMARMRQAKPEVQKRQADLLSERYDLGERPAQGVTMSRGKPTQAGVRVKLPRPLRACAHVD